MLGAVRKKLQDEVEALNYELSVTLPQALNKALALGDLRENGDYHAAIERHQFVQARLSHLRSRLSKLATADLSKVPRGRVGLGSTVKVRDLDTKVEESFDLVIADAMDFDKGQVSVSSPLGRALLNGKPGDKVTVRLPDGIRRLKILHLVTLHDQVGEADGQGE